MQKKFDSRKKIAAPLLLVFIISGSVFLFPQKVFGQGAVINLPEVAKNIEKPIKEVAEKTYAQIAAATFKTVLSQFLNKMAYDMAVAVATGAPGQKSLIFDDPNYFLNLGDSVMGGAIDDIAQGSGFTNMLGTTSLCQPVDLTTKVNLLLSFKKPAEPVKPRCSLSQISKSLAESANSFNNSFSLANLSLRFEMGDLEEARNSLRQALTVEKYLSSGVAIGGELSGILTDLENISDETAKLIQGIYQKPIDERQAAADGSLESLSNLMARLNQTQNLISELSGTIIYCNSSKDNCTESSAAGMCVIFVNGFQPNCSAAVQAAQTYIDQFQKLQTELTEGVNNFYTGVLEKAFTVPDASDPKDIANAFNQPANDMGKFFLIKEAKDKNVNIKIENEKLLQRISKDCEPKKDPISGMNVLPSSAACGLFNFAMSKSTVNEGTYTGIFSQAISIFTNTLAGKLMQTWFEKGVANLFDKGKGKNTTSASDLASGNLARGKAAAEERFLTLLQSNFTAGGPFEVLKELTVCPEQGAGPNNCIIDPDFSQAIAERLTLKEAMDKKLLDPKRPFGYLKSGGIGGILVEPSYLNGYPYRSMIVLRKFRIIPVGWELAAEWIKDPGKNTAEIAYTLQDVVNCYEDSTCTKFAPTKNPFYHLVDPGWVFLEQPAFCKRQGAGEKILAEEFICSRPDMGKQDGSCLEYSRNVFRQEYCADEQTCLLKNDDGSCRFYGYCSEDMPSWKLDGSSCRQEYNSCQTYGNKDGANVSYLEHTISIGGCNSGNADCQWYCEEAPLVCSGGSKNGEPCATNNDCAPTAGGIVDGICRPTDLWKCQGKNLIGNPSIEVDKNGWSDILGSLSNNRVNKGHESFASLSSQSLAGESGFFSDRFSTSAVCTGGSNDGTSCTSDAVCTGGGICKNGEMIDASAWVSPGIISSDYNSGAGIRIRAFNAANSQVQYFESERITELDAWKPVHISAPITDITAKSFILEAVSYGNNTTAMFDDLGLFRGDRISFDKDVKQCEAKDAGCNEFARTTNGANLVFNPSFEIEEKSFAESLGFFCENDHAVSCSGPTDIITCGVNKCISNGWYGWHLKPLSGGTITRDTATGKSGKASLKADVPAGSNMIIGLETADPRNNTEEDYKLMPDDAYAFSIYAKASAATCVDCLELVGDCRLGAVNEQSQSFSLTDKWERYSFDYSKNNNDGDYCVFSIRLDPSNTYWLDDAKIEIGSQSTNYKDYGSEKIYLNQSRLSCDLSEVGCELYTPVNGDVGIPAVAKLRDQCPAECVGYETYHEIPSYFDPVEDAAIEVVFPNLIPSTAVQCSAQAAGCEEFTNLDTVASGGEAKEYYTYLHQCAKPGTVAEATYYTWEGSEESGFQLRAWRLKSNIDGTPFTIDGSNICDSTDSDCRVFYSQSGQPYDRLLSKTVFISDDCHPLRRTIQGTRKDCENSGGHTDTPVILGDLDIVTCLYDSIPSQGVKCPAKEANCREYKGPSANSAKSLFKDDFEDPLVNNWTGGVPSSESVSVGGNSLNVTGTPADTLRDVSSIVQKNKTYLLKFWAKPANFGTTVLTRFYDGTSYIDFGQASLSDDWNSYVFGPGDFTTRDPGAVENLVIRGSDDYYIDNIEFIEVADDVFVMKDSWKTPASCDLDSQGNIFSGYALHCSAYTDRAKNVHNLKSFSKLCREDHVGCELLADTQNTQNYFSEWKSGEYAPADILTPIVNDDKKYCDSKFKGCQKFGRPQIDAGDSVTSWNSVHLINNPDDYKEILCQNTENWCKEYKTPDGAEKYFKDPGQKLCEYKEDIGVGNTVASGWFIKGQYEKINPSECAGAMRHCSIDRNGSYLFCRQDSDCQPIGKNGLPENLGSCVAKDTEWVRECPETQSSCTEYKDPLFSQTQGVKDGYYYLADTIDEGKCKGIINEDQKCVAFNNSEKPVMNVRASGTCKARPDLYCSTNAECSVITPDDICLMKSDKPFDPQACVRCSADQLSCNPDPTKSNPCCSAVTAAGQIACNANTILYVQKDRDCREWLSCVSSAKITNGKGEKEDVCYDVARCTRIDPVTGACLEQAADVNYCQGNLFCAGGTRNGQACQANSDCAQINGTIDGACQALAAPKVCSADSQCESFQGLCDPVALRCTQNAGKVCAVNSDCVIDQGPCIADSQTFDSPSQTDHAGAVDDLRYRSGFNPYGIHWDPLNQTRNGEYLPTATMQKGQVILLEDGDFENKISTYWREFQECSNVVAYGAGRLCVDDYSCYAKNTCDLGKGQCQIDNSLCQTDANCNIDATDTCNLPVPDSIKYERLTVASGLKAIKLDPGQRVYQGNYPQAAQYLGSSKPIFVSGNSQISLSGYFNTLDLKDGTAEVVIEEFKLNDGPLAIAQSPTTVMTQAPGISWKFYAGIFTTRPDTVSIRIVLWNKGTGGTASFDNFLMLPALNYQNQSYPIPFKEVHDPENTSRPGDNPFIGRSCRLYPQTNAPACFYTNEQKQQFQGWRGFCAEPDPVNPLHCLQWLPIDQLQGEAGLGFKTESSYSGKTPLYYCAEMSLWQLRCNSYDRTPWMWNGYSIDECPGPGNRKAFSFGFIGPLSLGVVTTIGAFPWLDNTQIKYKGDYDPLCRNIYKTSYSQRWSYGAFFAKMIGTTSCKVVGYGENNNSCVWVPYNSCPYGTADLARDISPNLIGRCDKLVQVVDEQGQNIAWTNRLDLKNFQYVSPYGYIYEPIQNDQPYGSIEAAGQADANPIEWQTSPPGVGSTPLGDLKRCSNDLNKACSIDGDCALPFPAGTCIGMVRNVTIAETSSGKYPLWIVPKTEDIPGSEMACYLSSGGSPAACTDPYCYNDKPTSPPLLPSQLSSPQCIDIPENQSFELNIPQMVRPQTLLPSDSRVTKNNTETYRQGAGRLQHLFAKSYGAWAWNDKSTCDPVVPAGDPEKFCSGQCDGIGPQCLQDSDCASNVCVRSETTGLACVMDDNCRPPAGQCTPPGGGVCLDLEPGDLICDEDDSPCGVIGAACGSAGTCVRADPAYVNKLCTSQCLGGSCERKCSVTGIDCTIDPTVCIDPPVGNVCQTPVCNAASANPGMACDSDILALNYVGADCSPLANNGTDNETDGCPNGACIPPGVCDDGGRKNAPCDYTPICTNNVCVQASCAGGINIGKSCGFDYQCLGSICRVNPGGEAFRFCQDNYDCAGAGICQGPPANVNPLEYGMCSVGGYKGTCSNDDLKTCDDDSDCAPGVCEQGAAGTCIGGIINGVSTDGLFCDTINDCPGSTCFGGTNDEMICINDSQCPGGGLCRSGTCSNRSVYAVRTCSDPSQCLGVTMPPANECLAYNYKCALWSDSGTIRGFEKLGEYCMPNSYGPGLGDKSCAGGPDSDSNGIPDDTGVCTDQWCGVGAKSSFACSDDNDCTTLNVGDSTSGVAPEDTYVNIGLSSFVPNLNYQSLLWEPPINQCGGNQRPYATQPPTQDIITETGEMCGVAPEIKFISKPGDPSVPVDILIDANNSVTINFLTMIDAEQRPIRQIIVDWGDPLLGQSSIGPYPDGTGLSPKTLASDPFIFTSSPYTTQNLTGYTITIMVQDNWNWCNGTANGMGNYGSACDCTPDAESVCTNWIKFPGKIIVK